MVSKFATAVKCFFKCPACAMSVMLKPDSLSDPLFVELLKERCPDVEVESLGYYAGLFLALLFTILCVIAYVFFYALRLVLMSREMLLSL